MDKALQGMQISHRNMLMGALRVLLLAAEHGYTPLLFLVKTSSENTARVGRTNQSPGGDTQCGRFWDLLFMKIILRDKKVFQKYTALLKSHQNMYYLAWHFHFVMQLLFQLPLTFFLNNPALWKVFKYKWKNENVILKSPKWTKIITRFFLFFI